MCMYVYVIVKLWCVRLARGMIRDERERIWPSGSASVTHVSAVSFQCPTQYRRNSCRIDQPAAYSRATARLQQTHCRRFTADSEPDEVIYSPHRATSPSGRRTDFGTTSVGCRSGQRTCDHDCSVSVEAEPSPSARWWPMDHDGRPYCCQFEAFRRRRSFSATGGTRAAGATAAGVTAVGVAAAGSTAGG